MPSIKKHGRKYRIQFRFNGQRYNLIIPQQIPVEFHNELEGQFPVLLSDLPELATEHVCVDWLESKVLLLFKLYQENNRSSKSIADLSEQWLQQLELRQNTIDGYGRTAKHLISFFKTLPISQIRNSVTHIQSYVDWRKEQGVGRQTIIRELTTLNLLFHFAVLPCLSRRQMKLPAEKSIRQFHSLEQGKDGRKVLLSDNEITELLELCVRKGSLLIADAVQFDAYTAARRSEVTRLKPSDIDLERKTITLTSYKKVKGMDSPTVVPIHDKLMPVMERRKECSPLVFTDSVDTLSSGFRDAIKGSKFEKKGFGFHALRHSLASRLIQKNVPVTSVSRILGHSRVSTTLDIYSHALLNDVRCAMEML